MAWAYLHGFASSPLARKGQALRRALARDGIELHLPDLNRPSFERLTLTGALEAVDELVERIAPAGPWNLVGSSFGGYVVALWAERNPNRIGHLLLLCPGFDLACRWPVLLGREAMETWKRQGELEIDGPAGERVAIHWGFVEDFGRYPAFPEAVVPTTVIHGRNDEVVPIESSRQWAARQDGVELLEVDDDHGLHASLPRIEERIRAWIACDSV